MLKPSEIEAYQDLIRLHKNRIEAHKMKWKLSPNEEKMIAVLERQAAEAEAQQDFEKAVSILTSITSAIHIKEGTDSYRTRGVSERCPSKAKIKASDS